jgi:hypothetical protein
MKQVSMDSFSPNVMSYTHYKWNWHVSNFGTRDMCIYAMTEIHEI